MPSFFVGLNSIVTTLLKLIVWVLRVLIFIALFGLAIKNSGPIELRFFFDQSWIAPVSLVVLIVFSVGVAIGSTVALGVMSRKSPDPADNL